MMFVINHIRYMKLTMVKGKVDLGIEFISCYSSPDSQYKSIHGIMGELCLLFQSINSS